MFLVCVDLKRKTTHTFCEHCKKGISYSEDQPFFCKFCNERQVQRVTHFIGSKIFRLHYYRERSQP